MQEQSAARFLTICQEFFATKHPLKLAQQSIQFSKRGQAGPSAQIALGCCATEPLEGDGVLPDVSVSSVREHEVAYVSALLFIDHLIDEVETIRLLHCDLITRPGSRVQDCKTYRGAQRRVAISQLRAHARRTKVAHQGVRPRPTQRPNRASDTRRCIRPCRSIPPSTHQLAV